MKRSTMVEEWTALVRESPILLAPLLALVFVAGVLWLHFKLFPYGVIKSAAAEVHELHETGFYTRSNIQRPRVYDGDGVTKHLPAAEPGLTMISGVFNEGVALRLIDLDGHVVREWPISFEKLWPHPTHIYPADEIPKYRFGYHVQGFQADPDGSVVVNVGELGMAKFDRCGAPLWTLDRRTHHAINYGSDGSYWAPVKRDPRLVSDKMKFPDTPTDKQGRVSSNFEGALLHVSKDGKILKEISVLQAMVNGAGWQTFYDVARIDRAKRDPTHVNDVEIVTPELAAKIAGVRAGDLLISLRNLHTIAILDQDDGRLLWRHEGPWVRQHDVDIQPDGRLTIFNNNDDFSWGPYNWYGGSNVMRFDPATNKTEIIYPTNGKQAFYTKIMGTQQVLENGDILIAESMSGRVFEAAPSGEIVWEYVKPFGKKWAAIIEEAHRYQPGYFTVKDWSCAPAK